MNIDNIQLLDKKNNQICNYNYNYKLQYFILYEKINKLNDSEDSEVSEDFYPEENLDRVDKQYNYDFLKVFNLEYYNSDLIDKIILELFNDLITNERLKKLMIKLSNSHLSESHDLGFCMMFSFNYFHILHKIINSYYTSNGLIDDFFLDELENKINE